MDKITIQLNTDEINQICDGPKLAPSIDLINEISFGLEYHIRTNTPLKNNVFLKESDSFNNLLIESKNLYNDGTLILSEDDVRFINEMILNDEK
jgi:hypothetical protein